METAFKLFLGRWSTQALTAAISTGILDAISEGAESIDAIAKKTNVSPDLGKRLLRAMSSLGVLNETAEGKYSLTQCGEIFTISHPESLRSAMLWEHSEELVMAWSLLPKAVQTGKQGLMAEALGATNPWEALNANTKLKSLFDSAMTSYSKGDIPLVLGAYDWENSDIKNLVDIGGGLGYLVSSIVKNTSKITGYVYELAETLRDTSKYSALELNVSDRVNYVVGDMFTGKDLPSTDAYILKHVLHDWDDESCVKILKVARNAAKDQAKLFIAEIVLSEQGTEGHPLGFLLDLHMMITCSGKERTLKDYRSLFDASGWKFVAVHKTPGPLQLIEAVTDSNLKL